MTGRNEVERRGKYVKKSNFIALFRSPNTAILARTTTLHSKSTNHS
jgi:hypothetical protein